MHDSEKDRGLRTMTWQDLKNIARYTYEQSRDAAYEKLQDRKKKKKQKKEDRKNDRRRKERRLSD